MDQNLIASIAGILISLAFSYVPKLDVWYAGQEGAMKRLVVLASIVVAVFGMWGSGCLLQWGACLAWPDVVKALFVAVGTSQAAYLIAPQTERAKEAKAVGLMLRDESEFGCFVGDDVA